MTSIYDDLMMWCWFISSPSCVPPLHRPDDVMLKRTHDETVLLHCFLWPVVTFLVGVLIVVLTICAKSLAVRAEAIKKKKHLWVARLPTEKKNLQEGLRWGNLTDLQVCKGTQLHLLPGSDMWWSCSCLRIVLGRLPREMPANCFFCYGTK